MGNLADLFYRAAGRNAGKEAVWCDGESLTYGELAAMAGGYTKFLFENGVRHGDHVGVALANGIPYVALMLAAADLGCALVPVNPTLPAGAVRESFRAADVRHVVARRHFLGQMQGAGVGVPGAMFCMDGDFPGAVACPRGGVLMAAGRPDCPRAAGDELYVITLTSGSTGCPKPIALTQANKLDRAMAHVRMYGITESDRVLAATPLFHSLAERLVLIPLLIGATSVLLARYTPQLFLGCVREQRVTFSIAVSAQLRQVAGLLRPGDHGMDGGAGSLRCVVSSSALLDAGTKEVLLRGLGCDFHEMYGTSETSTVTDIDIRRRADKLGSVGRPIAGADVRILGPDGAEAAPGEVGEIACKTGLLCSGYYGRPDAFSDALCDGYFRTGDLGRLDGDGFLYFAGRKKELIITGGINVYPSDVEDCVSRMEGVEECAAFPLPDDRLGEVVAVAIRAKEGVAVSRRAVQTWCARNLADFQQPHEIFFVDALPKNDMGKIVRAGLPEYVTRHGG